MNSKAFANKIAWLCYDKFKTIPKKGKPQEKKEWTLLAAIVASININNKSKFRVVAMSTGTKCLGQSHLSDKGDVVSDSHAEVLSRRAFRRFILHEMTQVVNGGKSEILELNYNTGIFNVKQDVKFHFFSSHTPCGDASIFPKYEHGYSVKRTLDEYRISDEKALDEPCRKKSRPSAADLPKTSEIFEIDTLTETQPDIFRTGAKCVSNGNQDPKQPGQDYHVTCALRTKPGRGDPTLSMCCSDKMAMWNVCGIQGSLLSHLINKPIYLSSITIGKCPFNVSSMQRAIIDRTATVSDLPQDYFCAKPQILQSELSFKLSKEVLLQTNNKIVPCPVAVIWSDIPNENINVCVNGRRQGITKKNFNKPSAWVSVCRRNILKEYINLLHLMKTHGDLPETLINVYDSNTSYLKFKESALLYQHAKMQVLKIFSGWTKKTRELQNFILQ